MSARRLLFAPLLFAALLLSACAARPATPASVDIDELRRAASERPADPARARALALGELFMDGGDPARASAALRRARELDAGSLSLLFADAVVADVHGQPGRALDLYLATLERALESSEAQAFGVFEAASYAILGLTDATPGYARKVHEALSPLITKAGLPLPARAALADVLLPLAYRRGDMRDVERITAVVGCVRELRVAGPFGPRQLLGFDGPPPAELGKALAAEHELGPGRGVRATRNVHARGCTLHLGGGPVSEAGTTLAQARVEVAKAGTYALRLETPNSVELYVDGRLVKRADRRTILGARVLYDQVELSAGEHLLGLRVSARHANPVIQLSLRPLTPSDEGAFGLPFDDSAEDGLPNYLRVAVALVRGDLLLARTLLEQRDPRAAPPLSLLQSAGVALADPLVPEGVRSDDSRRKLALALARDPELWAPAAQLSTLAAKAGRVDEAIAALREAARRWPEVAALRLALVPLLRSKNWDAAVAREIAALRRLVPDACGPLQLEHDALRARQRGTEVARLAAELVRCDAQSHALYTAQLARRDFASARGELARLASFEPPEARYAWLLAELSLHRRRGDEDAISGTLAELRRAYPRSYRGALEHIDLLAGLGRAQEAQQVLSEAFTAEPAAMVELERLVPVLGGTHLMAAHRKDGARAIAQFEASGVSYEGPQVLVLDYMAVRVFSDGSSLELVHTIQKAQSDAAVNDLGEVEVPEGARVLSLRVFKADGRKLEADAIAGKDSISLPNVARGDYVELEYLRASGPTEGFPKGYIGDRFYFTSFEVPFHHSEMLVILPKEMDYQVDPRGPAPELRESVQGPLRHLRWQIERSVPLQPEPGAVAAREYIPSVRVGVRATWPALVESLRDVLVDRDLYDPYYGRLVRELVSGVAPDDLRGKAERLYAYVLDEVDNSNDVFSQAALMLRAKSGNRARILHYLARLSGVPTELALARSFASDATESEVADAETYDHLLVRVELGAQEPLWLFTSERFAPFGFVPPVLRAQPALLLREGAPRVRVGGGLHGDDFRKFELDVQLRPEGAARIDVVETVHGSDAVAWRAQLDQIPAAELERRFEQDYAARLFPGAVLVSLASAGREREGAGLTLRYTIDVPNYARRTRAGLALPPLLATELSANFARTASRTTTQLLGTPVETSIHARIRLPEQGKLAALPSTVSLSGGLSSRPSFSESHRLEGGVLVIERALRLPAMRIEPKDYSAWSEFCRRVDESEARELMVSFR